MATTYTVYCDGELIETYYANDDDAPLNAADAIIKAINEFEELDVENIRMCEVDENVFMVNYDLHHHDPSATEEYTNINASFNVEVK